MPSACAAALLRTVRTMIMREPLPKMTTGGEAPPGWQPSTRRRQLSSCSLPGSRPTDRAPGCSGQPSMLLWIDWGRGMALYQMIIPLTGAPPAFSLDLKKSAIVTSYPAILFVKIALREFDDIYIYIHIYIYATKYRPPSLARLNRRTGACGLRVCVCVSAAPSGGERAP